MFCNVNTKQYHGQKIMPFLDTFRHLARFYNLAWRFITRTAIIRKYLILNRSQLWIIGKIYRFETWVGHLDRFSTCKYEENKLSTVSCIKIYCSESQFILPNSVKVLRFIWLLLFFFKVDIKRWKSHLAANINQYWWFFFFFCNFFCNFF